MAYAAEIYESSPCVYLKNNNNSICMIVWFPREPINNV